MTTPTRLYHGTSGTIWEQIAAAGAILPRRDTEHDNWKHSVSSHPDAVYLTDVYAPYFGLSALDGQIDLQLDDASVAVIEIEVAKLAGLVPDEDALEQSTRDHRQKRFSKAQMVQRTKRLRATLPQSLGTDDWTRSIAYMGTCAHIGPIPLSAISRVALVSLRATRDHAQWTWSNLQPLVSHANYLWCGEQYRALTALAFDLGVVVQPNAVEA